MSIKLSDILELRKAELNASIMILKGLLADPDTLKDFDNEAEARSLLVGRLESIEQALQNLSGDVVGHYHATDRDLEWATGKLPFTSNSDLVLEHLETAVLNPHNITYAILGQDLAGATLTNSGDAAGATDVPNLAQIQALIAAAVADLDISGIDLSGYEPAFSKNGAFNKEFGTTDNTVAEGSHGHSDLAAHLAATDNPHNVTYGQTGAAPLVHDHDDAYEEANENIQLHMVNNANPHAVTIEQIGAAAVEHEHENVGVPDALLTPSSVIYVDGNIADEYFEYFDYAEANGIEVGTEAYPFKTLVDAVGAVPVNGTIKIKPGVHYTDNVVLPYGVSLEGYGSHQVIISGNVQTGGGKLSLRHIEFRGNLAINGDCSFTECLCKGNITQTNANVIVSNCLLEASIPGAPWLAQGGIVRIFNSQIEEYTISLEQTDASLQTPNSIYSTVINGVVSCGTKATIIDGVYQGVDQITGDNLIYRFASKIANDSSVAGETIKDALNSLENASYTDADARSACIAQSITNGVTNSAPSQDVVNDALSAKVNANPSISAGSGTKITYDSKGLVVSSGNLSDADIPSLHADKINDGVLNIARIPAAAIERLVPVPDEAARFMLGTDTVQVGDTVKQMDTSTVYVVVNDAELDNDAGYVEYTVGIAAAVPWSGVTDKPAVFPAENHEHIQYALSEDVGDIANNPMVLSISTPETYATNSGVVEARHFAPADVDTISDFETDINLKVGTVIDEVFLFLRDGIKNTGRIDLDAVNGNTYSASVPVSLSSKNSAPIFGTPVVITNVYGNNINVTGNMPSYAGIRITITYTGDVYNVPIVIKDDLDNIIVSDTLFYDMMLGFSFSYSNGSDALTININEFFEPSITGVTYDATVDCQYVDAPDRYFIGVKIDGAYHYILGDGSDYTGFSLDSNNAILPGMSLGTEANTIVQDKNLVNLLGTSAYDEAFFSDEKTIYGVFNDVKDKLVERPTLTDVSNLIGMNGEIQLVPSFANCVFSALNFAPNTLGTWTTEYDSIADQNYYRWFSSEAVTQSYGLVAFIQTPRLLNNWTAVSFKANTDGAAEVVCKIYDTANNLLITQNASTFGVWAEISLSAGQLNTLAGGDWSGKQFKVIFEVNSSNDDVCRLGHVSFGFDKN